jgi:hypothetical protein
MVTREVARRDVVELLILLLVGATLGCRRGDPFARELVCIHIFDPAQPLPEPLRPLAGRAVARAGTATFSAGLPELVLARASRPLLELFRYFWPFTHDELEQLRAELTIEFSRETLMSDADLAAFRKALAASSSGRRVVVLTHHAGNARLVAEAAAGCGPAGVAELVILKDPSEPPYLCDYPARQKGFKKPPP